MTMIRTPGKSVAFALLSKAMHDGPHYSAFADAVRAGAKSEIESRRSDVGYELTRARLGALEDALIEVGPANTSVDCFDVGLLLRSPAIDRKFEVRLTLRRFDLSDSAAYDKNVFVAARNLAQLAEEYIAACREAQRQVASEPERPVAAFGTW